MVGANCAFDQVIQFVKFLDLLQRKGRTVQRSLATGAGLRDIVGSGGGFEFTGLRFRPTGELRVDHRDRERIARLIGVQ